MSSWGLPRAEKKTLGNNSNHKAFVSVFKFETVFLIFCSVITDIILLVSKYCMYGLGLFKIINAMV